MSDTCIIRADVEDMFGDITGFMSFMYSPAILACLKNSGFIAGGYPRYLLSKKRAGEHVDAFPINYFSAGGDIDVFFPTPAAFQATKQEVSSLLNSPGVESMAKFGHNFFMKMHNLRCKLQLIETNLGTPSEILSGFDFRNSMVGFDIRYGYIFDGWNDIEDSKIIDISRINSDANMFGQRVGKYVSKYDYKMLTPQAEAMLASWYSEKKFDSLKRLYSPALQALPSGLFFSEAFMSNILTANIIKDNELLTDFVGLSTIRTYTSDDYFRGTGQCVTVDAVLYTLENRRADRDLISLAEKKLQDYVEYKRELEMARRSSRRFPM